MHRLLALTLLLVILVPGGGAVAQDDSARGYWGVPDEELAELVRGASDDELATMWRAAQAALRESEDALEQVGRVRGEDDWAMIVLDPDRDGAAHVLDVRDIETLLPLLPLYSRATPAAQASMQLLSPGLAALDAAVRRTGVASEELLGMSRIERRDEIRDAVNASQGARQVDLASSLRGRIRRDIGETQRILELLDAEILARAPEGQEEAPQEPAGPAEPAEPGEVQTGFEGVWDSTYAPPLILEQSGRRVTGSYNDGESRMILEVTGERTLEGYWIGTDAREECETGREGSMYWGEIALVFDEDFGSYSGVWGYCLDDVPDTFWGYWQGDYIRALDADEE